MYDDSNRLDRLEALRLWTTGSSWFSTEDGKKGALAPGQLADLSVLSEDYFSTSEERIKAIESVLTIVGGKIVYAAEEFAPLAPRRSRSVPTGRRLNSMADTRQPSLSRIRGRI